MRRRDFIKVVAGSVAWPLAAHAQQVERARSIGMLMGWPEAIRTRSLGRGASERANEAGLDGRRQPAHRVSLERRRRGQDGDVRKELVDLRPDAIFGQTTPVIGAVARETRTIPIVFVGVSDPIGGGFAESLAHPSDNITGFAGMIHNRR